MLAPAVLSSPPPPARSNPHGSLDPGRHIDRISENLILRSTRVSASSSFKQPLIRPAPVADFGHIFAVSSDVLLVLNEFLPKPLLHMSADFLHARDPVYHIAYQVKPVELV